jgi:hypothetical protein
VKCSSCRLLFENVIVIVMIPLDSGTSDVSYKNLASRYLLITVGSTIPVLVDRRFEHCRNDLWTVVLGSSS